MEPSLKSPKRLKKTELLIESGTISDPYWTKDQKYLLSRSGNKIVITRLPDLKQVEVNTPAIHYAIKVVSPSGGSGFVVQGSSGFNALPGGILGQGGKYMLASQMANFWTSSSEDGLLIFQSLILSKPGIYRQCKNAQWPAATAKQNPPVGRFAISIRCIKDN